MSTCQLFSGVVIPLGSDIVTNVRAAGTAIRGGARSSVL